MREMLTCGELQNGRVGQVGVTLPNFRSLSSLIFHSLWHRNSSPIAILYSCEIDGCEAKIRLRVAAKRTPP